MNLKIPRLKKYYSDIIKGFSLVKFKGSPFYIKHPSIVESAELEYYYEEFYNEAIEAEIPTEADKEKYLIQNNLWSDAQNLEILKWKDFLSTMAVTKTKVLLKADIEGINAQIKEGEITLLALEMEKREKIGFTAEHYANQKFNDVLVLNAFYSNESLTNKIFSDTNELQVSEIEQYLSLYTDTLNNFREETLKKIAIQPFFINTFSLANDDTYRFYGKPIVNLTTFQISLFSLGSSYKSALSEYGGRLSEEDMENPDVFIEKVHQKRNIDNVLGDQDGKSQSIVGMTAEDRARAGISKGETISMSKYVGKSFEEIAREHNS